MPPRIIELRGRRFREIPISSVKHELHFWRYARKAGLQDHQPHEGEGDEEYVTRMLDRIIDADVLVELISDVLLPIEAEKWTPEIAEQTAGWMYELPPNEFWAVMKPVVASLIAGFFVLGPTSSGSSRAPSIVGAEVRPGG